MANSNEANGWFTLAFANAATDEQPGRIKLRAQGDTDLEPVRATLKEP